MTAAVPPLPIIDTDSRPFWESCRSHAMAIQRCASCGSVRFPPRRICPVCGCDRHEWIPVSGEAVVYASLVVVQAPHPFWSGRSPFNLSLLQLAEGVRMWANVTGCAPDEVRIGDRVHLDYEDVSPEVTLPRFIRGAPKAQ